jgi:hypothetical protein
MAAAKKQSSRGRKQERAGALHGEGAVKKAVKKVGGSRKRVERRLGR